MCVSQGAYLTSTTALTSAVVNAAWANPTATNAVGTTLTAYVYGVYALAYTGTKGAGLCNHIAGNERFCCVAYSFVILTFFYRLNLLPHYSQGYFHPDLLQLPRHICLSGLMALSVHSPATAYRLCGAQVSAGHTLRRGCSCWTPATSACTPLATRTGARTRPRSCSLHLALFPLLPLLAPLRVRLVVMQTHTYI